MKSVNLKKEKLKNPKAVAKTLRKLEHDKEFKLHKFGEIDVWEFHSADDDEAAPEAILDFDGLGIEETTPSDNVFL